MVLTLRFPSHIFYRHFYQDLKWSSFTKHVANPENMNQIYVSQSLDPYLNLSIEHYLFQSSSPDSTILFIYSNKPSVILGRNQNPWNEINMGLLRQEMPEVQIVRRRSGGGTVFHDEGNVNYSVIGSRSNFNRDKHLKMVVQALKLLGVEKVGFNKRHDIVIDRFEMGEQSESTFKISGSAFKLTRLRSLHHGTCLISSPNIKIISKLLNAPAKKFVNSRGVESISSRVTNLGISRTLFQQAVIGQFCSMYSVVKPVVVDDNLKAIPEIKEGISQLKSNDWIYCQTPPFTFTIKSSSKHPIHSSKTIGEAWKLPPSFHEEFSIRNGRITNTTPLLNPFLDRHLHRIYDWRLSTPMESHPHVAKAHQNLGNLLFDFFSKRSDMVDIHDLGEMY